IVSNLLVLLQSLDEDGDPENGITINEAAAAAATQAGSLDLTVPPADFVKDAKVTALVAAVQPGRTPVEPAKATAHFKSQFFTQLEGIWYWYGQGKSITFTFDKNGGYTHYEVGPTEGDGWTGTETGT